LGSAGVAGLCAVWLLVDHTAGTLREEVDKDLILALEERVQRDATLAPELEAKRKRQTDASLARESRGRDLAWVLLLAGTVFVASGKWLGSLEPPRLPSLDALVAVRFAAPAPAVPRKAPSAEPPTHETDLDLGFVDELVERFGRSREAAVPILQAIQGHYRFLPDEALRRVCELTEITPAQIAGTSSFYSQFRRSPVGRFVVRVCHGTACHVAGAEQITQELRRHLEIAPEADTDPQRLFTIDRVACLGCCSLAPVMMIEEETAGRLTPASARQTLDALKPGQ
jgi:NADH:ubiquinone oxidoreductase subunit E